MATGTRSAQTTQVTPISAYYRITWLTTAVYWLNDIARGASLGWTDHDFSANVSPLAQAVYLFVRMGVSAAAAASSAINQWRAKGLTATFYPTVSLNYNAGCRAGGWTDEMIICGLNINKVLQYNITIAGMTVDTNCILLGYME